MTHAKVVGNAVFLEGDVVSQWGEESPERAAFVAEQFNKAYAILTHVVGLKYKCGCAAVPSEKVKAFCPEHLATLAE